MTTWDGRVEARVPGEAPRVLFGVTGMNIARCLHVDGRWHLTSRELMYYLDPDTGAVLDRWQNPWTGATVPVVHVANGLVQNQLRGPAPLEIYGDRAVSDIEIHVVYPNPLATTPELRPFSPQAMYDATERFRLSTLARDLRDASLPAVPDLDIRWNRTGPWLPWMDMGSRPGHLAYDAVGRKVDSIASLPALLRDGITNRVPLFLHAPECIVPAKNDTSWTYFARHVEAYKAAAQFPIAEPPRDAECANAIQPSR